MRVTAVPSSLGTGPMTGSVTPGTCAMRSTSAETAASSAGPIGWSNSYTTIAGRVSLVANSSPSSRTWVDSALAGRNPAGSFS